jgi:glycosyltransferase involved in cell wall biosynthesis
MSERMRIGFVMEQVLGHVTWYQNLRRGVEATGPQRGVEARWVETAMWDAAGRLERTPGGPAFVKASGRAYLDLRRGLRGWPYDVLLFNTQKAAAFCQWQMLRTPTLLMTDVTPVQYDQMAALYDHAPDRNPLLRGFKRAANTVNFRLAAGILASSTWARDSFVEDYGVPPERVHVLPIGADTDYWRPLPQAQQPPQREPAPKVQLLFVGGHLERKGGRLLLDVFRQLRLHERADLHIVTRSELEPSQGVHVHRGMQNNSPELLRLFQESDVFVLPTLADCFGNASIEALAVGLPVITTAMGGIPDIVSDGETGYLLAPGDAPGLARALTRVVDDPQHRRTLGAAARQRAVTRFDCRTNAGRILDLAQHLLEERQRRGFPGRRVFAVK